MTPQRIYLSGPIKGIDDARLRFRSAAAGLTARGYEPVNPFDCEPLCVPPCTGEQDERHYDCFMRADVAAMMTCSGLAMLFGWEASRGARLEHAIALQVGLPVRLLHEWNRP